MTAREVAARLRALAREDFQRACETWDESSDFSNGEVYGKITFRIERAARVVYTAQEIERLARLFRVWEEG